MKQFVVLLISLLAFGSSLHAQTMQEAYADYIEKYADIALKHQRTHGIPASITLAQGLLESSAGTSYLAKSGNNHFGIKCSDWKGEKIYADDDSKNECFRKYRSVESSFDDHAEFLTKRGRYKELFNLDPTDYEGWAYGLRKAGYATDPRYATKLIRIIEDYDLHKFDIGKQPSKRKINSKANKKNYIWNAGPPVALTGHDLFRNNGVKCIFTEAGDTFESISNEFNISVKRLLKYNDLQETRELEPNTVIYLAKKKKRAAHNYTTHVVSEGENMYRISQKYAIRLQSLYDMNNKPYSEGAKVGEFLILK